MQSPAAQPQSVMQPDVGYRRGQPTDALASSIRRALSVYPYFYHLKSGEGIQGRSAMEALLSAVAHPDGHPAGAEEKISFTRVRIDNDKVGKKAEATHYSRTHLPLAPHTDSSNTERPHELIAFQMIRADASGGENTLVPVDDILKKLDGETIALLSESVYPFGRKRYPVLSSTDAGTEIRYYTAQIKHSMDPGSVQLSALHRNALSALDEVLDQLADRMRVRLEDGDTLIVNNRRALHGRTGFSEDSQRLMNRYRLYAEPFAVARDAASAGPVAQPDPGIASRIGIASESLTQADDQSLKAQLQEARALSRKGRREQALSVYLEAARAAPDDTDALQAMGELLLEMGRFSEATEVFRRCRALAPASYECNLALSSLLYRAKRFPEARDRLEDAVRGHPLVVEGRFDPQRPTLLRARGFSGSKYSILKHSDGRYSHLLRGGHFAVTHLLRKKDYNVVLLNVLDDNIEKIKEVLNFDALVNTISCPDLERTSLLSLARFIDRNPELPVINDPRKVLQTAREKNHLRLSGIDGVTVPRTERITLQGAAPRDVLREVQGLGFSFPFIMRPAGSQTGSGVVLVQNSDELEAALRDARPGADYYLIEYIDCRRRNGLYNKKRVFCIDGVFYPVASLYKESWSIHSGDRYNVMDKTPWMQDEERACLEDFVSHIGSENLNRLHRIRDIVDLDFFGIDFTLREDGTLLLFEVNPAMRHNYDHVERFPYTRPCLDAVSAAFDAMVKRRAAG
jgi:tetratricopeptide (TPR) repeat protein